MPTMPKPFRPPGLPSRQERQQDYDRRRGPARQFYGSKRWRKFRAAFLAAHPLCQDCEAQGQVTAAVEVHHDQKRRDNPEATFDPDACRSLCKPCHSRRTRRGE